MGGTFDVQRTCATSFHCSILLPSSFYAHPIVDSITYPSEALYGISFNNYTMLTIGYEYGIQDIHIHVLYWLYLSPHTEHREQQCVMFYFFSANVSHSCQMFRKPAGHYLPKTNLKSYMIMYLSSSWFDIQPCLTVFSSSDKSVLSVFLMLTHSSELNVGQVGHGNHSWDSSNSKDFKLK